MTIRLEFNALYKAVFSTKARYIDIWGGRARGGSHFATDYFLFLITQPGYFRGCFLRAVFGDIRGSLWQDFKDRVEAKVDAGELYEHDFAFNESLMTVTYKPTGNSIISKGFKKSSGSQSAKLKSLAGITHVTIEECEEVAEADFNQLDDSLRTDKVENIQVLRLFNPPSKNHWLMKRFYNLIPSGVKGWYKAIPKAIEGFLSIWSTYLDNRQNLNPSSIRKYQAYGDKSGPGYNEDFYYRDVCGFVSEGKKGRIITRCYPITYEFFRSLPYPSFYGLDFGYSDDPVALVELKFHNNKVYKHLHIYEPGLLDPELAAMMKQLEIPRGAKIYADNSEPKSIATLKRYKFNVIAAEKGPDSVRNGIKFMQSLDFFITEESMEAWREVEEYSWQLDAEKNPTDEPEDKNNHSIDADRYALTMHVQKKAERGNDSNSSGVVIGSSTRSTDRRDPYDMLDDL